MTGFPPLPSGPDDDHGARVTPTGHLSALAPAGELLDWRLAVTWEALWAQGVLGALPGPVEELATATDADPRAARIMLDLVASWGLVTCDENRVWREGPITLELPLAEALAGHGAWIRRWALAAPARLAATDPASEPARGSSVNSETRRGMPERGLRALAHASARNVRPVVAACLGLCGPSPRVLDLGGGHGWYAHEFREHGAEVTLQDLPPVVEVLRGQEHCRGIRLHPGDARVEAAPGPFDLVFCCTVTNMLGPDDNRALIGAAARQLAPGGVLAVVSFMRDRGLRGTVFGVQMLANTDAGDAYGADEYTGWLVSAGLARVHVADIADTGLTLVAATSR